MDRLALGASLSETLARLEDEELGALVAAASRMSKMFRGRAHVARLALEIGSMRRRTLCCSRSTCR